MREQDVRLALRHLDGKTTDDLESETLDFTRWDPDDPRRRERAIREAVVCFANAQGGILVVGVRDRVRTRKDAIEGVGPCDIDALRKSIYDGTDPHILVDIEELKEPEGRLLVIRVPRGIPPHTTSDGVARIRVGKECRPLKGSQVAGLIMSRGQQDLTAQPLPGSSLADVDPAQVQLLRRLIDAEGGDPALAKLGDRELLASLELLCDSELTLAAVLFVGKSTAISRWAPQHEVTFLRLKQATRYDVRRDLRGPLLEVLEIVQRLLEAHSRITTVATSSFAELTIPDITWFAAREAVLNALVHRDYFLRQSVQVELRPDRLEIVSPGGFVGEVTPENVLRHPPVRRNRLLACVLQTIGLVNRAGLGVDRIYEELLRLGKPAPRFAADEGHVRLTLPLSTSEPFARFVARETKEGRALELDDLIALRGVAEIGMLDRRSAASRLQGSDEQAAALLASLRARGYVVAHGRGKGTAYRLNRKLSDDLRGSVETDLDVALDTQAVAMRVEAVLAERGRLTNADVRRLSGYTRLQAARMMRGMVATGRARLVGRGRAAHYVPGDSPRRAAASESEGSK